MVSYKLDKYDKYFVAFVLFILTIFNISSCFATEDNFNELSFSTLSNRYINNFTIEEYEGRTLVYFELQKGHTYRIYNEGYEYNYFIYKSDSLDIGTGVNVLASNTTIPIGGYFEFKADSNYICSFYVSTNIFADYMKVYDITPGQSSAVNDLVENVGPQQLWSVFESGVDFIGVVVLVAFGLFLIVLLIKKLSKGKSDF